jgi:hypothetical protein
LNYLAHGFRFLDDPYFLVGTAIPDWLSVVDRSLRLPPVRVRKWVDALDPRTATLARGVMQHHEDDAAFHVGEDFAQLNIITARAIRSLGGDTSDLTLHLLAHIVPELLLDWVLTQEEPQLLDRYYQAVAAVDGRVVAQAVSDMSARDASVLERFVAMFLAEGFLRDYGDDERLCFRLGQVLRRVGWGPLPTGFSALLPSLRLEVQQRRGALLAFIA